MQLQTTFKKTSLNKLLALAMVALAASPVMAQAPAQPDVADAAAYLLAGIVTLAVIGNAKLIVRGAMAVFRWVGSMIR